MEDNKRSEEYIFDIKQDPYNHAMRMVFSKWKPFIIRAMDFDDGKITNFSRFMKQLPITQKVLSENLRQLENDGIVKRTVIPTIPPRVEYTLTDLGRSLLPILQSVYEWAWADMKNKNMEIDTLGEMWHGLREKDLEFMKHPYRTTHHD